MAAIIYVEPELVIALNKRVIFVNPNDLQIFKEVELPSDLTTFGVEPVKSDKHDKPKEIKIATQNDVPFIQNVALSQNRQLLAVTTAGQKALLIYQCRPEHAKLVSVRALSRASSALAFSSDSSKILVTDKTGDCYEYDNVDLQAEPRLLFGHLSIVYDVLWTADENYIITCDRDDKIRITNYPDTFNIHNYCLGHKEFVSGISYLQGDVIASISGDQTLRIWNYQTGKELAQAELPGPAIRFAVRRRSDSIYQVAVLFYQSKNDVGLYEISSTKVDSWNIVVQKNLNFDEMDVCNLCFAEERLYVAGTVNGRFTLRLAQMEGVTPAPENWLEMVDEQFKDDVWRTEDIGARFRKRFDNVSEYLERKKRRIEERQK